MSIILGFPLKFSLEVTFVPFSSPVFTTFPVTSSKQMFSPSERKKKKIVFAYFPPVPLQVHALGKCSMIQPSLSITATADFPSGPICVSKISFILGCQIYL